MHFIPDTEDEDSAAETFWPEGYKQVIREDVRQALSAQLANKKRFRRVYRKGYSEKFSSHNEFLDKITDMVAIGAENGADDAFDEMVYGFLDESALPELRRYVSYLWPQSLPRDVRDQLHRAIVDEYSQDDIYRFAYNVGYKDDFGTFDEYMDRVAELVETGAMNGANDTLEGIYRSFANLDRLVPARRHPRRLKMW